MKFPWRRRNANCAKADKRSKGVEARNLRAMRPSARRTNCRTS